MLPGLAQLLIWFVVAPDVEGSSGVLVSGRVIERSANDYQLHEPFGLLKKRTVSDTALGWICMACWESLDAGEPETGFSSLDSRLARHAWCSYELLALLEQFHWLRVCHADLERARRQKFEKIREKLHALPPSLHDWDGNETSVFHAKNDADAQHCFGQQGAWRTKLIAGPWGQLKAHWLVDQTEQPALGKRWQTDDSLHVPFAGPLFLFSQLWAGYNTLTAQEMRLIGHYGVGFKVQPLPGGELQLRGGPFVSYAEDPLRPERAPRERNEMLIELQYRHALVGPLGVEYVGSAVPTLDPLERFRLRQDLGFAVPLLPGGYFRFGARSATQDLIVPRGPLDGLQLYLGVGIRR